MANKVISIKLDEKDIERLKKYHEALKGLGIISDKTLSMNALYKHLLLDYLEEDVCNMISSYKSIGLFPMYFSREEIECDEISFANVYGLDKDNFATYTQCIKEKMVQRMDEVDKNIDLINEVMDNSSVYFENVGGDLINISDDKEEKELTFWMEKAIDEYEHYQETVQKDGLIEELKMIQNSSISEAKKHKLISAIEDYEKSKINNMNLLTGRVKRG